MTTKSIHELTKWQRRNHQHRLTWQPSNRLECSSWLSEEQYSFSKFLCLSS